MDGLFGDGLFGDGLVNVLCCGGDSPLITLSLHLRGRVVTKGRETRELKQTDSATERRWSTGKCPFN